MCRIIWTTNQIIKWTVHQYGLVVIPLQSKKTKQMKLNLNYRPVQRIYHNLLYIILLPLTPETPHVVLLLPFLSGVSQNKISQAGLKFGMQALHARVGQTNGQWLILWMITNYINRKQLLCIFGSIFQFTPVFLFAIILIANSCSLHIFH